MPSHHPISVTTPMATAARPATCVSRGRTEDPGRVDGFVRAVSTAPQTNVKKRVRLARRGGAVCGGPLDDRPAHLMELERLVGRPGVTGVGVQAPQPSALVKRPARYASQNEMQVAPHPCSPS